MDTQHHPVSHAQVIIKGRHVVEWNETNAAGCARVTFFVDIPDGFSEDYFDVIVKASCATTVIQDQCIRVVRLSL